MREYTLNFEAFKINSYVFTDINMGTFLFTEPVDYLLDEEKINYSITDDNLRINDNGLLLRLKYNSLYVYCLILKETANLECYNFDTIDSFRYSSDEVLDLLSQICELPTGNYIVGNVQDYISIVEKITSNLDDYEFFFRGHYSHKYTLKPSLFRKKKYSENENFMYMDFKTHFYKELSSKKYIEILTTMQHYKMPTRLLDTTSNPLVALYMACDKPNNYKKANVNIGEVIIMHEKKKNVKYSDSNSVLLLSSLAVLETNYKQEMYEKIMESLEKNDASIYQNSLAFKRFVAEVRNELPSFDYDFFTPEVLLNPCHVKVGMVNERIIAQSGNFILFGLCDYQTCKYNKLHTVSPKRLFIVNRNKILKQLSMLNINESTMYPDKDHMSLTITKDYD